MLRGHFAVTHESVSSSQEQSTSAFSSSFSSTSMILDYIVNHSDTSLSKSPRCIASLPDTSPPVFSKRRLEEVKSQIPEFMSWTPPKVGFQLDGLPPSNSSRFLFECTFLGCDWELHSCRVWLRLCGSPWLILRLPSLLRGAKPHSLRFVSFRPAPSRPGPTLDSCFPSHR